MVLILAYPAYKCTTQCITPTKADTELDHDSNAESRAGFSTSTRTNVAHRCPHQLLAWAVPTFLSPSFCSCFLADYIPHQKTQPAETRKLQCLLKPDRETESKCCICKDEHFPAELIPEAILIQLRGWNKLLLGQRNLLSQSIWTLFLQVLVQEAGNMSSFSWNQEAQTRNSLSWIKTTHDGNCYYQITLDKCSQADHETKPAFKNNGFCWMPSCSDYKSLRICHKLHHTSKKLKKITLQKHEKQTKKRMENSFLK